MNDRGSTFLLCERSRFDDSFARYPSLPVLRCPGFEPLQDRVDPVDPADASGELADAASDADSRDLTEDRILSGPTPPAPETDRPGGDAGSVADRGRTRRGNP